MRSIVFDRRSHPRVYFCADLFLFDKGRLSVVTSVECNCQWQFVITVYRSRFSIWKFTLRSILPPLQRIGWESEPSKAIVTGCRMSHVKLHNQFWSILNWLTKWGPVYIFFFFFSFKMKLLTFLQNLRKWSHVMLEIQQRSYYNRSRFAYANLVWRDQLWHEEFLKHIALGNCVYRIHSWRVLCG